MNNEFLQQFKRCLLMEVIVIDNVSVWIERGIWSMRGSRDKIQEGSRVFERMRENFFPDSKSKIYQCKQLSVICRAQFTTVIKINSEILCR